MKKERVIRIKTPKLREIRNNLRLLLRLNLEERRKLLIEEVEKLKDVSDTKERLIEKREQIFRLNEIILHSICKCRVCSSYQNNVVYTRLYDYWLCVECYRSVQEYYRKKGESISIRFNILDPSFKE